jgi:hypothetical protein
MDNAQTQQTRPVVFEIQAKFKDLIEKRRLANEKLLALLGHPQFRETGNSIFEVHDMKVKADEALRAVVTAARQKYPKPTFMWNYREFDVYDNNLRKEESK